MFAQMRELFIAMLLVARARGVIPLSDVGPLPVTPPQPILRTMEIQRLCTFVCKNLATQSSTRGLMY